METHKSVSIETGSKPVVQNQPSSTAVMVTLIGFLREMGVTEITGWRWRKKGWLRPVNICGRLYLTAENIAEFNRRAAAGEFAQQHKTPAREVAA